MNILFYQIYINNKTKIKIKHNTCGHEYEVRPNDFQQGCRCPKCANNKRSNHIKQMKMKDNYLEDLIINEDYTWLEDYKGNNKLKHKIRHNTCGHEYEVRPNDFQQGYRCPLCASNTSKNMKYVVEFLNKHKIPYKTEIKFEDCRRERILSYDILIDDSFILEIDGRQHFQDVGFFNENSSSEETFIIRKERDRIKNEFIRNKDYVFVRLHYRLKKDDVNKILSSIINNNFSEEIINKYILYCSFDNIVYNEITYYTHINKKYFDDNAVFKPL